MEGAGGWYRLYVALSPGAAFSQGAHRVWIVEVIAEDQIPSGIPCPNVIDLDCLRKRCRIGHAAAPVFELSADDRELGSIGDIRCEGRRRNAVDFEHQRGGGPFQAVNVPVLAYVGGGAVAVVPGVVVIEEVLIDRGQIARDTRLDLGDVDLVVGIGPRAVAPSGVLVHDGLASGSHHPK